MALERLSSRSHPALGEDSDSDIEVPRFQSLDYAEDSDGDLEVEKNKWSLQIVSQYLAIFYHQVERDIKIVEETVVLEHMTHTDLAQVRLQHFTFDCSLPGWPPSVAGSLVVG